ncbi:MAG: biotin--[acetyl-CoA-carboxylase] ligase [Zoogloeaceae bacterium]|jgi:BirA family biotin operon repressor/biotin-[acetyl-CoA-carboxylase] ligase|nr:biotin--[acetyl-CoA-carboxylase] ligase [Zoogloeaceae bacterium]
MSAVLPSLDAATLAGRFPQIDVRVIPECGSTNALLLAERALPSRPQALIAQCQTAGRGRRGRSWISAPETSLTFSLRWRWQAEAKRLSGLSLALGLALAEALESLGFPDLKLKWPNDLVTREGAKLAGILVELDTRPEGLAVVMGFGLNLAAPEIPDRAVAGLADCDAPLPPRQEILTALLRHILAHVQRMEAEGFAVLRPAWLARHLWQDRQVRLLDAGSLVAEGCCRGVDNNGALLLESADGRQKTFMAGDLSLRPAEPA